MGTAIAWSMGEQTQTEAALRTRLKLIATTPELQERRSDAFRRWCDELVRFAAHRLNQTPKDLLPLALGHAAQGAIMAALSWWATQPDETTPAQAVQKALTELERHLREHQPTPADRPATPAS